MKRYVFPIYEAQLDSFFAPIRNQLDYIITLTEIVRTIYIGDSINIPVSTAKVIIEIGKMSRVHVVNKDKYYSLNFPFGIFEEEGAAYKITSKSIGVISVVDLSFIRSVFSKSGHIEESCIAAFADKILDQEVSLNGYWPLIKELLLLESGYIRFDHDHDRENGKLHPRFHLDVFYSSASTFKLGLSDHISDEQFTDLLNTNTDCHFVT